MLCELEPIHISQSTVDKFKQIYFFYVPLDNIRKLLATNFWYFFSIKSYKEAKMRFLGFITRDISEVGVSRLTWNFWCVLSKISLTISWEWIFEIDLLYFFINDKWWNHHNFTKIKNLKSPSIRPKISMRLPSTPSMNL